MVRPNALFRRPFRRNVRLFGTFDRFNYGDLLFPIVTRLALRRFSLRFKFSVYGLRRSDLTNFGALPSRGIADLYADSQAGDVVLMPGGENLAQSWSGMYLTLLAPEQAPDQRAMFLASGENKADSFSRTALNGKQRFPYLLRRGDFESGVRLMYNSCGGWPLQHYRPDQQQAVATALTEASFVGIRDQHTAGLLRDLKPSIRSLVNPDVVFLISEFFSAAELERRASPAVRQLMSGPAPIVFQCRDGFGSARRDEILDRLRALHGCTGRNFVLAPLGRIHASDDTGFLADLATGLGQAAVLLAESSIFDLAFVISRAHAVIGTSLHGIVTALAYGVPAVALETEDPKVSFNLDTWRIPGVSECVGVSALCPALSAVTHDRTALLEPVERLKQSAWDSFAAISHRILSE